MNSSDEEEKGWNIYIPIILTNSIDFTWKITYDDISFRRKCHHTFLIAF